MQPRIRHRVFLENASDIAAACGCSRTTLYRVLEGKRRPSVALRARIEACGLKIKPCRLPKGI